jgi:hypothetical protein
MRVRPLADADHQHVLTAKRNGKSPAVDGVVERHGRDSSALGPDLESSPVGAVWNLFEFRAVNPSEVGCPISPCMLETQSRPTTKAIEDMAGYVVRNPLLCGHPHKSGLRATWCTVEAMRAARVTGAGDAQTAL